MIIKKTDHLVVGFWALHEFHISKGSEEIYSKCKFCSQTQFIPHRSSIFPIEVYIGSHWADFKQISERASIGLVNQSLFNPIALRKAKIAYNFGLYECNRVKQCLS